MPLKKFEIIGSACGLGAQLNDTHLGPESFKEFGYFPKNWRCILKTPNPYYSDEKLKFQQKLEQIVIHNRALGQVVEACYREEKFPIVLGGDHSSAVGLWSAMSEAFQGDFGLIWIDAHMDAHTPQTSPSQGIHGMPVAALLGYGSPELVKIVEDRRGLRPQNIALIGVRSFEEGEARLLADLNVKIYPMSDVRARGFKEVLSEAIGQVTRNNSAYGISLDLDAFDPTVAPGVGSPAPDGLMADEVCEALSALNDDVRLKAFEIAEFNPVLDKNNRTLELIERIILSVSQENTEQWILEEAKHCANNYKPIPVVLSRGQGVWLWDIQGKRYLDMMSAYSAVSFGHSHPRLVAALNEQSQKLAVTSRAFHTDTLKPFLAKLCEMSKMDKALPVNTGVEAVETAIKAARKWGYEVKGVPKDRAEIIVAANNFHGRTTTVVGFSSDELYKKNFGPLTPGFIEIPFGDAQALRNAISPNTCAFLVEPMQGEAGIIMPPDGWLKACEKICHENNVLLILDEVQTGLGRTGALFAFEHENVRPDGLILGKALGGGLLPVSAFLAKADVMAVFSPGTHGSTFGGNPLAARVGFEALLVLEEEALVQKSAQKGDLLLKGLQAIKSPIIKEVRGKGLWVAIEIDSSIACARDVCVELMKNGILTKETHNTVIRFAPPLIIDEVTLKWAIFVIEKSLKAAVKYYDK